MKNEALKELYSSLEYAKRHLTRCEARASEATDEETRQRLKSDERFIKGFIRGIGRAIEILRAD